jgi:hypothetical protein
MATTKSSNHAGPINSLPEIEAWNKTRHVKQCGSSQDKWAFARLHQLEKEEAGRMELSERVKELAGLGEFQGLIASYRKAAAANRRSQTQQEELIQILCARTYMAGMLAATFPSGQTEMLDPKGEVAVPFPHKATLDIIPEDRKTVIRSVLLEVSSATSDIADCPDEYSTEERFAVISTQINADLAQAAVCEAEEDLSTDTLDGDFNALLSSSEYQKLRDRFIFEATEPGHHYAFQTAVWRGYNAGRVSPERFTPRSQRERTEERLKTIKAMEKSKAIGERRRKAS